MPEYVHEYTLCPLMKREALSEMNLTIKRSVTDIASINATNVEVKDAMRGLLRRWLRLCKSSVK
jgi:hypothetical protein